MKPAGRVKFLILLRSLSGLATCSVCGTIVSWKFARRETHDLKRIRCPICGGSCEVHPATVCPELEVLRPPQAGEKSEP